MSLRVRIQAILQFKTRLWEEKIGFLFTQKKHEKEKLVRYFLVGLGVGKFPDYKTD